MEYIMYYSGLEKGEEDLEESNDGHFLLEAEYSLMEAYMNEHDIIWRKNYQTPEDNKGYILGEAFSGLPTSYTLELDERQHKAIEKQLRKQGKVWILSSKEHEQVRTD